MEEKAVNSAPVEKSPTLSAKEARKKEIKSQLRYQRDKDREMVKGIFKFHEVENGSLSFCYKLYKEDPVERYDLTDGQIYTIPLGVAKHINKNLWYPVHEYQVDEAGRPSMRIGKKIRRASFNSLEFVDIDDITAIGEPLVTVEKAY